MKQLIQDVLTYLPNWSIHPSKHNHQKDNHMKPFMTDDEIGELHVAKRVTITEIESAFQRAEYLLMSYTGREKTFIDHPIAYQACCVYSAGLLYNKYTLTSDNEKVGDKLISEAKTIIKPFIRLSYNGLNKNRRILKSLSPMKYPHCRKDCE